MEAVHFCAVCGRMLENDFLYCPYCGTQFKQNEDLSDLLDEPFEKLEVMAGENTLARLCKLEKDLGVLERDLDEFLARG